MYLNYINKLRLVLCVLFFCMCSLSFAQNKLEVSKKSGINLRLSPIHNAGLVGEIVADDTQWLNYTVLIGASDPTVSIAVNIASGSIPEGIELYVEAGNYKGFSRKRGKVGNPVNRVRLSHQPMTLINNIGTSYTGSGRNEGHQLTFYFKVIDYSKLEPGTSTIYVQYTLTQ